MLRRYGWLGAIAIVYLYLFPYYPKLQSANELPRVYLVQAIVEDHTFAIDHQIKQYGGTSDLSAYRGHSYQNKAPGASLIVVPFYAAWKAIAGTPSLAQAMWLCRIVTCIIPSLLFLWLLWGYLERFAPEPATRKLVLYAYAFGSMAFTYSLTYYAHQPSTICLATAWILGERWAEGGRSRWSMFWVGLLAGLAPTIDYQTAFAGVPLVIYLIVKMRARYATREILAALAIALVGAAIPLAVLLAYHRACFGSPFATGYNYAVTFGADHVHGLLGMTYPKWDAIVGSTVAPSNGFIALAPWWLLAIMGGKFMWRTREHALVVTVIAVTAILFYFVTSLTAWHAGWEVGPRYIVALQPFLLPLVAYALARWDDRPHFIGVAGGLILLGVVVYTTSTATLPTWPDSFHNPVIEVAFRLLHDNAGAPTILHTHSALGVVPVLALVAILVGVAIVNAGGGLRGLVIAVVIAALGIAGFHALGTGQAASEAYARTLYPAVAQ
ncbi:MAG: hypothetical protein QM831_41660 [Kofleriaceae bacterium]